MAGFVDVTSSGRPAPRRSFPLTACPRRTEAIAICATTAGFVFAAPRDVPRIAGVVFAEHSEHGYLAAPIARHLMETFFAKAEGDPLPVLPPPARPAVAPDRANLPAGGSVAEPPASPGTPVRAGEVVNGSGGDE